MVAFEPSPALGARLIEHCGINGVRVDLHAYALANAAGALPFYANASGNPGMSTFHPVDTFTYDHRFVVATLTADEVIGSGRAAAPTAMILDAEGAETEVLRGFGARLSAPSLRVLVFEAPNDFLGKGRPADLHALLTEAGFRMRMLERNERTGHNLSNFAAYRA